MPIGPIPETPPVPQPPEATAQDDVREHHLSRNARRGRRRKRDSDQSAEDRPPADGHIDTLA